MAEDVNSLKKTILTDAEFMDQANLVYEERRRMMDYALDHYLEPATRAGSCSSTTPPSTSACT